MNRNYAPPDRTALPAAAHSRPRTVPLDHAALPPTRRLLGLLALALCGLLFTAAAPVQRPLSMDVKEADIHNVLRLFARAGQVNIVVSDQVAGKVTMRLAGVPWNDALQALLASRNLGIERMGEVLYVDTLTNLRTQNEARLALQDTRRMAAPLKTVVIPLSYARADELKPVIQSFLTERGSIMVDARTNTLIITDVEAQLEKVQDLLRK